MTRRTGTPPGRGSTAALTAPELVDLEVASVLSRLTAAGRLDGRRSQSALADLLALPLRRVPHRRLVARCWELRHNLSIYDAAYVALAEAADATLLTADRRLARAAVGACAVEVLLGDA